MSIDLKIYGTRGSLPNTAPNSRLYGGATSCYHANLDGSHVVFDAGSGIVELGAEILKGQPFTPIDVFFTHFHYDHMMGLPFFAPLFQQGWPVRLWTSELFGTDALDKALDKLFSAPLCPITLDLLQADISLHTLPVHGMIELRPDVVLYTLPLHHPGGNAGYRIEHGNAAFVYSGDFEHGDAEGDNALFKLLRDADIALLDCTYTPETYKKARGYGHAHWQAVGEMALSARVKSWFGIHHEHMLNDATLLDTENALRRSFPTGTLAREGMTFTLG